MTFLRQVTPPSLPDPEENYRSGAFRTFNNILRLYFNRIVSVVNTVIGVNGGRYIECPSGMFYSSSEQFLTANTPVPIVLGTTYISNAVSLASSDNTRIEFDISGIYTFLFTCQLLSTNSSVKKIDIWIRKNGSDIPYSTRSYVIDVNSASLATGYSFNLDMLEGDYLQMMVVCDSNDAHLHAEGVAALHPGVAATTMAVTYMSSIPTVPPTLPST